MKIRILLFCLILFSVIKAQLTRKDTLSYEQVGDISFNEKIDDPDFHVCPIPTVQYYHIFNYAGEQYKGDMYEIGNQFKISYIPVKIKGQTGYITIRFLVNCTGETGLFRVQEMDMDYKFFNFDTKITEQLMKIIKSLRGWEIGRYEDKVYNYYQYLTFKIEDGLILEILP